MSMEALKNIAGEKTEFGPGKTALYYNNVGLFSDPFLEDRLPNLEEYYKNPSTRFLNEYWNIDESDASKYNKALQDILDLWNDLDQDIPSYCANERQLQNSWIDKIFAILGWTIELEESSSKHGITNFPDYALFASHDDWKKSKTLSGNHKFKKATAVADAKGWGINLDGKGFSNKNPSYQIINYLKQTDKNWGVLTDGKYWRIYSLRSESKHTTYYEIDLEKILSAMDKEDGYERFKYFYNFFRVEAFVNDARLSDRSFLDFVFDDGKFYSQRVENNLQERVYKVVDSICKGFLETYTNPTEQELKEVYEYSMYYLFKLMFVLNCESKGLLEVNKQDDYYDFSLRKMCMDIKEQFEAGKTWSGQPKTYNHINDLFTLLKAGDSKIGVHGFGEEPFEIGSEEFYSKHKISDEHLNHALLELSCDYDEEDNLQFIDYKILSPDHIGSLFEGLLEFNLIKKGKKVELLNTKGDRKATGSYYTPEYLVDYIVEEVVSPLINKKDISEITKLKILDPSMGSGHFLLGVVKFLEKTITELQDSNDKIKGAIDFDKIKKEVLKNCVFGIDINPLATQLAKFSLWIYTSQKGDYLEPLSDQLVCANALLDSLDYDMVFKGQIHPGSIDAVVGNPPYIGEKGNKEIFHPVKEGSLGKYYYGKMDYFYFFFHKSLDLLHAGGRAGLVSTNYFGTATGAKKLRADLKARATIESILNFNELKIFKGAQGQHNQVTFFSKGNNLNFSCKCYSAKEKGACDNDKLLRLVSLGSENNVKNADLYNGDDNILSPSSLSDDVDSGPLAKMKKKTVSLLSICNINSGIQSGADKVTNSHISKYNLDIEKGTGIFVLSKDEARNLDKNKACRTFLKPFFKNSDIGSYTVRDAHSQSILYLGRNANQIPKEIEAHLKPYKKILDKRREVVNDVIPWFQLQWPRSEDIFSGEKIVAPQRSRVNKFGYHSGDWYASVDVYFITEKDEKYPLKFILGILNSKLYFYWLYHMGKRKGEMLELYQQPLGEVPIPNSLDNSNIIKRVESVLKSKSGLRALEEIDNELYDYFKLTAQEIKQVEGFYEEKIGKDYYNKIISKSLLDEDSDEAA